MDWICRCCVRYWDTLLEMFYPRFEYILLQNVQSIRECDPQKLGHIDVRPQRMLLMLSLSLSTPLALSLI